jgi:hypothetical protein
MGINLKINLERRRRAIGSLDDKKLIIPYIIREDTVYPGCTRLVINMLFFFDFGTERSVIVTKNIWFYAAVLHNALQL